MAAVKIKQRNRLSLENDLFLCVSVTEQRTEKLRNGKKLEYLINYDVL
jgi:hypothetical protein